MTKREPLRPNTLTASGAPDMRGAAAMVRAFGREEARMREQAFRRNDPNRRLPL